MITLQETFSEILEKEFKRFVRERVKKTWNTNPDYSYRLMETFFPDDPRRFLIHPLMRTAAVREAAIRLLNVEQLPRVVEAAEVMSSYKNPLTKDSMEKMMKFSYLEPMEIRVAVMVSAHEDYFKTRKGKGTDEGELEFAKTYRMANLFATTAINGVSKKKEQMETLQKNITAWSKLKRAAAESNKI